MHIRRDYDHHGNMTYRTKVLNTPGDLVEQCTAMRHDTRSPLALRIVALTISPVGIAADVSKVPIVSPPIPLEVSCCSALQPLPQLTFLSRTSTVERSGSAVAALMCYAW